MLFSRHPISGSGLWLGGVVGLAEASPESKAGPQPQPPGGLLLLRPLMEGGFTEHLEAPRRKCIQ